MQLEIKDERKASFSQYTTEFRQIVYRGRAKSQFDLLLVLGILCAARSTYSGTLTRARESPETEVKGLYADARL